MAKSAAKKMARKGRPTEEQSRRLDEQIVSTALELFLEHGYDGVTMDTLASRVGITKRTLYLRYKDKSELFLAAFDASKGEWEVEWSGVLSEPNASLEDKLKVLAEAFLQQVLNPRYIKLGRIAVAQTARYPEEIRMNYDASLSPRIQSVVRVLEAHRDEIESRWCDDLELSAELFVGLITGMPARLASMGTVRDLKSEKARSAKAVALFVRGLGKN